MADWNHIISMDDLSVKPLEKAETIPSAGRLPVIVLNCETVESLFQVEP